MRKGAEPFGVAFLFCLFALASTYPLVRGVASHLPSDLGDPLLTTWTLAWDADRIRHGFRGLWDAPNFFPYRHTLLYSDHLLGVALFTAPLQWLTGNPVLVYNVAYLGSFVLAGCGMYLLARELTGRRDAALLAGLIYACQPFRVSHLAHLQWLMTGWLPLSVWALHRYFSTRAFRHLLAATGFFLLQSLTAAYFTYFALVPLLLVGVVEIWRTRLPPGLAVRHLAGAGLLVVMVTAPVALAYYQVREQYGFRRTSEEIAQQSADVGDYLSAPPRVRLWSGLGSGRGEHELFPGAVALLLAALGIGCATRRHAGHAKERVAGTVALYAGIATLAFVLSLGTEPTAWGHRLGVPGPYRWLLPVVPGLDGLRAVARLAVVVQMAIAALAAFGIMQLLERLTPPAKVGALLLLALAIVAEGWAAPIPTAAFDPHSRPDSVYSYLRSLPRGAVMELPTSLTEFEREFVYQYRTLDHGHPVVNGHSGYITPLIAFLGGGQSPLNEVDHLPAALAMLRSIGVRYLILHGAAFEDRSLEEAWLAAVNHEPRQVVETHRFEDSDVLATLAPLSVVSLEPGDRLTPPPEVRRVPAAAIRARASHSPERLPALFDGDPDSRWLSGGHQTGSEWIELELDRARDVRVIRLELASRSFGDYPRDLAVEVNEASGVRTLFRGPVLAQLVHGLLKDPTYPNIEIVLPENQATLVRLRQLGTTHGFFWSIHELELAEAQPRP